MNTTAKFMVKTPTRELFFSTPEEVAVACEGLRRTCIISIFANPGTHLIWQGPAAERPTVDYILSQVKVKISSKDDGIIRNFWDFGLEHESEVRERFCRLAMRDKLPAPRPVIGCGLMVIDDPDGWVFFVDLAGNYLRLNDALGRLSAGLMRQYTDDRAAVQISNLIHGIVCYPPSNRL